jgi:hypothetical protein
MRALFLTLGLAVIGCGSSVDEEKPPEQVPIYAHSPTTLFRFDPSKNELTALGDFESVNGGSIGNVTDLAIDKSGVMYAAVFGALYRVEYKSGPPKCTQLATIGAQFNGLAVVADGTLLGVESGGSVHRIVVDSTGAKVTKIGDYGGHTSSGDIASGDAVYAATKTAGDAADHLVTIDPATGNVTKDLGSTGIGGVGSGMYGIAYAKGVLYGFASNGSIYKLDPKTAAAVELPLANKPPGGFWGAAAPP